MFSRVRRRLRDIWILWGYFSHTVLWVRWGSLSFFSQANQCWRIWGVRILGMICSTSWMLELFDFGSGRSGSQAVSIGSALCPLNLQSRHMILAAVCRLNSHQTMKTGGWVCVDLCCGMTIRVSGNHSSQAMVWQGTSGLWFDTSTCAVSLWWFCISVGIMDKRCNSNVFGLVHGFLWQTIEWSLLVLSQVDVGS